MAYFRFHQYQVVGRALPSESAEHPKIYRMKLWATNEARKVKKSNEQVLAINEFFEKNPRSRIMNGGVEQIYNKMASHHRIRFPCIQIIKTATIPAKLCKRESTKQFHNSKIKFPLVFKKVRPPTRKLKTTYKASRPNLFL
ncbi:hypothetical protein UlMin_006523 [Ulmus minor]